MRNINNIIVNQRIVYIIDRNHNLRSAVISLDILFGILDLGYQNTRKLLFQNLISRNLQIPVNGQVDIIARLRVLLLRHLKHAAHTVHVHLFIALGSLELRLHILLDSGLSHNIIQLIIRIFLLKSLQLF